MPLTEDQARRAIQALIEEYNAIEKLDREMLTEAQVVHQFLDRFFEALGWPINDPVRFKYELNTQAGRPDMMLIPEQGGTIYIEAKRFGGIEQLAQARWTTAGTITPGQLALPGMAADRTPKEQQAINYAFENGGTWAILTNFEKLRLFNARRDWLVLSFERPIAYLEDFELLWQLSYENIVSGGLELLSNQRLREDVDTSYLAFINEWRERLARDIVANLDENPWAVGTNGNINLDALRAVVQRVLDRLVVVRYAEDHLVIPPGTLYQLYESTRNPYAFPLNEQVRQLFRRFDEDHNSALFAPGLTDQAVFSDDVLAGLVEKLYEARYRAMTPDIMGNTYEQYLGLTLVQDNGSVQTAANLETRKKQGTYYTPQVIVRYLVDNSLGRYLYGTADGKPDGEPVPNERRKTAGEIQGLRVLDPACGSGSFLIYAYEVLAEFYRAERRMLEAEFERRWEEILKSGQTTEMEARIELLPLEAATARLRRYPSIILEQHLYGVDLDPQAAEIATVNLIMRAMADLRRERQNRRLPLILNQNIKVGNSLIGAGPDDPRYADFAGELAELRRLRGELAAGAHGGKAEETIREIADGVNAALNEHLAEWFEDVDERRPFNWAVEFPEVFVDEAGQHRGADAGFDVVVGNPPWEIVKPDLREFYAQFDADIESKLTRRQAEKRIRELNAIEPQLQVMWQSQAARIEESATYYRQSPDYTRQGRGDTATHKLFVERAYGLLKHEGRLGYVVPSGIYTDLGTQELREMLLEEGHIQYLFSFSNERFFFPGVDHRFKFVLLGAQHGISADGFWAAFRFNPRVAVAPEQLPSFLAESRNLVYVRNESIRRFSPESLSVMEFQSQRDANTSEKIYSSGPLIGDEDAGGWNVRLNREFDMTNDRALFNTDGDGYPLFEGKMIYQYDAHYTEPRFWVSHINAEQHFRQKKSETAPLDYLIPRLGFREITFATNERTLIATIIPPGACCNHKISVASPRLSDYRQDGMLYTLAVLNSLALDYIARFKITSGMSMFHFYQLPLPRLNPGNPYFDAIVPRAARLTCTRAEFADLWQDVMGEPWDEASSATDPGERQRLRDEIDALVAHLYGLSRDDFEHILGTFPLVFPDDEAGRAKKAALLAVYDEFGGWARQ